MDVDCSEFENLEASSLRTTGNEKEINKDMLTDQSELGTTQDELGMNLTFCYELRCFYVKWI